MAVWAAGVTGSRLRATVYTTNSQGFPRFRSLEPFA